MRSIKLVTFLIVFIGTGYPVFELSRSIIQYMLIDGLGYATPGLYYSELALIWGFYIGMFWLLNKAINLIWKMGKRGEI